MAKIHDDDDDVIDTCDIRFPPGIHFKPSNKEIVTRYLLPKSLDPSLPLHATLELDVSQHHPSILAEKWREHFKRKEKNMFFVSGRNKKYRNGGRPDRSVTDSGFWKPSGTVESIKNGDGVIIGKKRILDFWSKEGNKKFVKTIWKFHEYTLEDDDSDDYDDDDDDQKKKKRKKKKKVDKGKKPAGCDDSDRMKLDYCVFYKLYKANQGGVITNCEDDSEEDEDGEDDVYAEFHCRTDRHTSDQTKRVSSSLVPRLNAQPTPQQTVPQSAVPSVPRFMCRPINQRRNRSASLENNAPPRERTVRYSYSLPQPSDQGDIGDFGSSSCPNPRYGSNELLPDDHLQYSPDVSFLSNPMLSNGVQNFHTPVFRTQTQPPQRSFMDNGNGGVSRMHMPAPVVGYSTLLKPLSGFPNGDDDSLLNGNGFGYGMSDFDLVPMDSNADFGGGETVLDQPLPLREGSFSDSDINMFLHPEFLMLNTQPQLQQQPPMQLQPQQPESQTQLKQMQPQPQQQHPLLQHQQLMQLQMQQLMELQPQPQLPVRDESWNGEDPRY